MRGFFFTFEGLSSVWLLFINSLTQRSRFEVLLTLQLTRNVSLATILVPFVPTVPRRRRAFTGWNIEVVVHSNSASNVVIFFHQTIPSLVSSPSQSPPLFLSPSLSTRRNHLSPWSPSSRKPSNVQLVPACVASVNIHNTVFCHLEKKPREAQMNCFLNEQDPREQAAINELTKKTPRRHGTTTTSVGWALTNAKKRNQGRTYMYVLGHRDGRFCDVYIRPVAVKGLSSVLFHPWQFFHAYCWLHYPMSYDKNKKQKRTICAHVLLCVELFWE